MTIPSTIVSDALAAANEAMLTSDVDRIPMFGLNSGFDRAQMAGVVNLLDPDVIVLGGGLSNIDSLPTLAMEAMRPHVFSDDINLVETSPYYVEFRNYFYLYTQSVPGTRPLFLCRKSDGLRFLTTRTDCEMNGARERQIGFLSPTEICGAVPLYRLYQESSNNHFYTLRAGERDNAANNLNYTSLGILGYVWPSESGQ